MGQDYKDNYKRLAGKNPLASDSNNDLVRVEDLKIESTSMYNITAIPMLVGNQWGQVSHNGTLGLFASLLGTGTETDFADIDGPRRHRVSAATLNAVQYLALNRANLRADYFPFYTSHFSPLSSGDVRHFIGLAEWKGGVVPTTYAASISTDPSGIRLVGLHFDSSRGDINFQWVEDNNTEVTFTDTEVVLETGVSYWLDINLNSIDSFSMNLLNGRRTEVLSSKTVTSLPFESGTANIPIIVSRNLAAIEGKGIATYNSSEVLRVI